MSKLFPSELLSLALGRPSLAASAGDVITQLTCRQINSTVLPTLAFDNDTKFSLLLLVEYGRIQAGKLSIGQLVTPNFIIQGGHRSKARYEHYHSGQTLIFQINSRLILFSVKDFANIHQAVSKTHNGLNNLHLLLATTVQIAVDRDRLHQVVFLFQASEPYDVNFSVVSNSVRHFARHTFSFSPRRTFHTFYNSHGYFNTNFNSNVDFIFYAEMP